jgi:hypothetical protein
VPSTLKNYIIDIPQPPHWEAMISQSMHHGPKLREPYEITGFKQEISEYRWLICEHMVDVTDWQWDVNKVTLLPLR